MIKRCNGCEFIDVCTKKDRIKPGKGNSCMKTVTVRCKDCEEASTCERYMKIENQNACPAIKRRIKETKLDRYGYSAFNMAKVHETKTEKYGEHYGRASAEKANATKLERYGYTGFNLEKAAQTKLERYGDANYRNMEKVLQTRWEKYTISDERVKALIKKYTSTHYEITSYHETEDDFTFHFRCKSCGYEFDKSIRELRLSVSIFSCPNIFCPSRRFFNLSDERFRAISDEFSYQYEVLETYIKDEEQWYKLRCRDCGTEIEKPSKILKLGGGGRFKCPNMGCPSRYRSRPERELGDFIESLGFECKHNTRELLGGREIDLYIPEKKLAIEVDGVYYHNGRDNSYKWGKCQEKGVRLIQILDIEWYQKQDKIKSYIKSQLGVFDKRIYARECEVKEIPEYLYKDFSEKNHLQLYAPALIRVGLYHKGGLVQVMSFAKPRYNKDCEWELLRESSLIGTNVIGGKSKLLKYFIRNYKPSSILSYCSKSKFSGISYLKCGFKLTKDTGSGYMYYKDGVLYNRVSFQKHKLKDKLENFNPNLTEFENMSNNGYWRIYNYGNLVFEMHLK